MLGKPTVAGTRITAGYGVISCPQGASDVEVLELANREERIMITFDKDFGELVFKEKLIHKGVIFLRLIVLIRFKHLTQSFAIAN